VVNVATTATFTTIKTIRTIKTITERKERGWEGKETFSRQRTHVVKAIVKGQSTFRGFHFLLFFPELKNSQREFPTFFRKHTREV